jgi:hypothetical protein
VVLFRWSCNTRGVSEQAAGELHRPEVRSSVASGHDDAIAPITRPYAITTLDLLGLTGGMARFRPLDVAAGTGVVVVEAGRSPFTSLPAGAIDRAAAAFADVAREQSTSEGIPHAAAIGMGAR